tara:strand:+ start:469 stop:705 length:237 start_codon:yes stop_codon:yes gene_type:complete
MLIGPSRAWLPKLCIPLCSLAEDSLWTVASLLILFIPGFQIRLVWLPTVHIISMLDTGSGRGFAASSAASFAASPFQI